MLDRVGFDVSLDLVKRASSIVAGDQVLSREYLFFVLLLALADWWQTDAHRRGSRLGRVINSEHSFDGAEVLISVNPPACRVCLTLEVQVTVTLRVTIGHRLLELVFKLLLVKYIVSTHRAISVLTFDSKIHKLRVLGDADAIRVLLYLLRWSWRQGIPLGLHGHRRHLVILSFLPPILVHILAVVLRLVVLRVYRCANRLLLHLGP